MEKRVLILANSSSGLYDFRGTLLQRLLTEGYRVTCAVPDDVCVKDIKVLGASVVHTPMNRRGMNPIEEVRLMNGYRALIRREQPDVVLTYTIKPNIYGGYACRKEGVPYIATVTGLGSVFQGSAFSIKIITQMYRAALRDCVCIFFQNEANRAVFENLRIPTGRTRLVKGSGVDLQRHRPEAYPGHEGDVTRFLYVGRLMKEKGALELLTAFTRLQKEYHDRVQLTAVGYTEAEENDADAAALSEAIAEAKETGCFEQLPYDTDIHPHYRQADAVLMPSYHEGMSNVLMEASATARCVLASDIPGCKEIVDDKVTGFLFPAKDTDALYEAMKRFAETSEEERRTMGVRGREKMEREFDRERITDAYMEELRTALGTKE